MFVGVIRGQAPKVRRHLLCLLVLLGAKDRRCVGTYCVCWLIDDTVNSNHTKFGVSNSNSLAPPLVQKFNFEMLITFEP